jgi:hypothetical protein
MSWLACRRYAETGRTQQIRNRHDAGQARDGLARVLRYTIRAAVAGKLAHRVTCILYVVLRKSICAVFSCVQLVHGA